MFEVQSRSIKAESSVISIFKVCAITIKSIFSNFLKVGNFPTKVKAFFPLLKMWILNTYIKKKKQSFSKFSFYIYPSGSADLHT